MTQRPADRLASLVRERTSERPRPVDLNPSSAYEAITRQMVNDLVREIGDLRRRIDSLFYLVVSAIIIDVIGRVLSGGLP